MYVILLVLCAGVNMSLVACGTTVTTSTPTATAMAIIPGSIGLLLWGMTEKHTANREDALSLLSALADSSLWISDRVLRQARKAIDLFYSE